MALKIANFSSTLSRSTGASDRTIYLTSTTRFPALDIAQQDYVNLSLEDTAGNIEIVKVTVVSGNALTVERGVNGTTARAFTQGSLAEIRNDPVTLRQFINQIYNEDQIDAPSSGYLTKIQITTLINQLVAAWAFAANQDRIPETKINYDNFVTLLKFVGLSDGVIDLLFEVESRALQAVSAGASQKATLSQSDTFVSDNWGILRITGYDDVLINYDDVRALPVVGTGVSLDGTNAFKYRLSVNGSISDRSVFLGYAAGYIPVVEFTTGGSYNLGVLRVTRKVSTASQIKAKLETLSGAGRLDASAIKNLPTSDGSSVVVSDSTLTGDGTAGTPLSVTNPFTAAQKTKLDGIEAGAKADQTGAEIRDALQGLSNNDRLDSSAIKNLPQGSTVSNSVIDARIKSYARTGNTTDKIPYSDLEKQTELTAVGPSDITDGWHIAMSGTDGIVDSRSDVGSLKDVFTEDVNEIPAGGTKDQVLAKKSDTDYDVEYQDKIDRSDVLSIVADSPLAHNVDDFETALRHSDSIVQRAHLVIGVSDAATRLAGNPQWPSARTDRNISFLFYPDPNGDPTTYITTLSAILALTSVSDSAQLNSGNSIQVQSSDRSITYSIARVGNQIAIGVDTIGSYFVSITDSEVDLEDAARVSSTDRWTRSKLPADLRELPAYPAQNQATSFLAGDGTWKVQTSTGLTQPQVDARIKPWARSGDTSLIPVNKLPEDLQLIDRNIVDGGWRSEPLFLVYDGDGQNPPVRSAAYTISDARAANNDDWEESFTPPAPRQTNVNTMARVARSLFNSRPTDSEEERLRISLDSNAAVTVLMSDSTYLGASTDGQYDFYNVIIPDMPADSVLMAEFDAPTELENIEIPASSVVGLSLASGLKQLLNGNITSPAVTSFNGRHNSTLQNFSPLFDLDDNQRGFFHTSLRVSFVSPSDTLSFRNDETTTEVSVTGSVAASDLIAASDFASNTRLGVRAITQPIYVVSGSTYTEIGALWLTLVHNSDNEAGFVLDYVHNARHTESGSTSLSSHLIVDFQPSDAPVASGNQLAATPSILTRESLNAAVTLADPTQNEILDSAWTDIFSHTVTGAEGTKGFMHIGASIFCTLTLGTANDATTSPDRGGDRPLLVIQLIKGTEEQGRNYRYFRFTGGVPLDCVLAETISVASGDVIKVRAQMSRLTAAAATLGASVTTDSHWERFSTS